jgi:RNA polymerase sigma-70 factor (ECF subfamily)
MTALLDLHTPEHETLTALVTAAQAGDRTAFGQLVERYQHLVYALALRRMGNHAEAQELCQEVFVQALRKIGQLREPACFGGWLKSIVARMGINRLSRRSPVSFHEPEAVEAQFVEHETPVEKVLAREREHQVREGLGRLGKMDRETLVAFYVRGRTLIEMSDEFQSPVGTIKRRLHVARKRLARELESMEEAVAV